MSRVNKIKTKSVHQICHVLYDFLNGKFDEDDIRDSLDIFMKLLKEDEKHKVVRGMKVKLEDLYHVLHRHMVDRISEPKEIDESEDKLLTVEDVCSKYSITRQTLNNWSKRGLNKTVVGGRVYYLESELERFQTQ